jgi:hypothetical protein
VAPHWDPGTTLLLLVAAMETWRAKPLGARGAYDMRVLEQVPAYASRARAWAHVPHWVQEVGVGWRNLYGSDSPGVWQGGRVLEGQAAGCFSLRGGHGNR